MNGTISRNRVYHIIRSSNRRIRIQASRLVAMAWIPNPENKPFVCHKDNNPLNNNYINLYWGTQAENIHQCVTDKRFRPQGKIPLTKSQIEGINQDYRLGYSSRELIEKYNITHIYRYLYPNTNRKRRNMKTKKIAIVKDRYEDGLSLEISHNGYQTTSIGNLDLEDLKKLRKVVRKAIREYENN